MSDYQSTQKKQKKSLDPLDPKKFTHIRDKYRIDPNAFELICKDTCKGASEEQLDKFCYQCAKLELDPAMNQIHFVPRWDHDNNFTPTTTVGIEGQRSIADRTGLYAGSDEPVFHYQLDGSSEIKQGPVFPLDAICIAVSIKVHKTVLGHPEIRYPFTSTAYLRDYVGKNYKGEVTSMWRKVGIMLPKCAEAGALRKAFPQQLGPIYIPEEVAQLDEKEEKEAEPQKAQEAPVLAADPVGGVPGEGVHGGVRGEPEAAAGEGGAGGAASAAGQGKDEAVASAQPATLTVKQMSQKVLEALRDKYKEQTSAVVQGYICALSKVDRLEKVPHTEQTNVIKIMYMALTMNSVQYLVDMVEEKVNAAGQKQP